MNVNPDPTVAERLVQLLDHLGIDRAHFCARTPPAVFELAAASPERAASITIQGAAGQPEQFGRLADRTLWLLGDSGENASLMTQRLAAYPQANVHWLKGLAEFMWTDTAAQRTDEVAQAMLQFVQEADQRATPRPVSVSGDGEVAGISYRAAGSGTPIVLLPLGLSAHQWDPLLPSLQREHCVVVLGGRHLDPVAQLEARGESEYSRMAVGFLHRAEPRPDETLIEVGCGSGALLRRIARHAGMKQVTGLDINSFLLREARALAASEGLSDQIAFKEGSAEAVPFPDASFDIAFSSTVMEEVDAEKMMAEMARITKPGGRVAVVVRAVDFGSLTNLPVSQPVKERLQAIGGGVGPRGCADETLCRRFHDAGLKQVRGGPAWVWVRPTDPWWRQTESQIRGRLSQDESEAFSQALTEARSAGLPVWIARPFHCAIGIK